VHEASTGLYHIGDRPYRSQPHRPHEKTISAKRNDHIGCDVPRLDVLNAAGLCPAISVVGLFYLFTVMFTFVVDIESYG